MARKKKDKEETVVEIPPNASPELVEERMAEVVDAAIPLEDPQENWDSFHDRGAPTPDPMIEEGVGDPIKREPFWRGGPLDTVKGMPWHSVLNQCPPGSIIVLLPGLYSWGEGEKQESVQLGKELELEVDDPSFWTPEKIIDYICTIYSEEEDEQEIEEDPNYVRAQDMVAEGEGRKQTQQLRFDSDSGQMVPAPVATILHKPRAVPVEIKLANNQFKINTTEEGQENIAEKSRDDIREWVIPRMKVLKDATIRQGDFDAAVDLMVQVILGEVDVEEVWKDNVKQASPAAKGEA
jgi:hypothetical protein